METIECIKSRRSRRLFLEKEVSEEMINTIIECALSAPSSMNCQPWHFVLVKAKKTRKALAVLKDEGNQQHIMTAPVLIVVCVDQEKCATHYFEDAVTATQNILLAAHDLGLGAVYITGCSQERPEVTVKIKKVLALPENILPVTILPIGYPDPSEQLHEKTTLDPAKVVHHERW